MKEKILERIKNRQSVVGIVGLGYVGLPIAIDKAKAGYMVIGFDVNADKVKMINNSKSYIQDIDNSEIAEVVENNMLIATDDFSQLKKVDIIEICVPTPLDKFKQPDLSYVKLTCETISKNLINGQIIVMKSTTYPGTTVELIKPILEKSNLQCGKDFFLGFSPERIDPGNKKYKSKDMPQIVGGFDDNSREIISQFYGEIYSNVFEVSSPSVAEMSKLLENTFRNVNISLVNEMAILCNKMNISIWEVIESAKTKPFGFMPFYPGSGAGGHCIPLDPCYLEWKAKEFDFHTTLIECSSNINDKMSDYCLSRISKILNNNCKSIKNSSILFLGVAYKQDIGDCRESSSIKLIEKVVEMGGIVKYYDYYVNEVKVGDNFISKVINLNDEIIAAFDLIIISTAHTNVDYDMVCKSSKMVFDIKNATKNIKNKSNIEVL